MRRTRVPDNEPKILEKFDGHGRDRYTEPDPIAVCDRIRFAVENIDRNSRINAEALCRRDRDLFRKFLLQISRREWCFPTSM
jgi:hypothetical protein